MTDSRSHRPTLCIGILAMNEARRIAACVASASFADQVLVIDSGSTDNTRDIAAAAGAEVHVYAQWEGFATQRNRLLAHVSTRYIFFLDADEVIAPALRDEILELIASDQVHRAGLTEQILAAQHHLGDPEDDRTVDTWHQHEFEWRQTAGEFIDRLRTTQTATR